MQQIVALYSKLTINKIFYINDMTNDMKQQFWNLIHVKYKIFLLIISLNLAVHLLITETNKQTLGYNYSAIRRTI
jgi:hypothetical protein